MKRSKQKELLKDWEQTVQAKKLQEKTDKETDKLQYEILYGKGNSPTKEVHISNKEQSREKPNFSSNRSVVSEFS